MTAGATATADFELVVAVVRLQDVVTTATGEQRKIELGHAVATLGDVSTRVEQTSITNMSDLLVAKVAGMVVIPGAFTNGAPMIRIRGLNSLSLNNSPIFVVDGVRMNIGGSSSNGGNLASGISVINDIDPSTIEDVEVVKGPSAATLYGTDAANGVVVITTKRGKAGKNRWTFNAEQGSIVDKSNYLTAYMIWGHAPNSTTPIRCFTYTISAGTCIADSSSSLNIMKDKTGLSPLADGLSESVECAGERRHGGGSLLRQRRPRKRDRPDEDAGLLRAAPRLGGRRRAPRVASPGVLPEAQRQHERVDGVEPEHRRRHLGRLLQSG